MAHSNTLLRQMLAEIPRHQFRKCVEAHSGDHRVRQLSCWGQFTALLTGQLSGCASLRDLTGTLRDHRTALYHSGATPVSRSTLAGKLFALDATVIALCLALVPWAKYRQAKGAIKLHTLLDLDGSLPTFVAMTDGKTHDIKAARKMKTALRRGDTVAMDRAYLDWKWLKSLSNKGIRWVTRAKPNLTCDGIERHRGEKGTGVIWDERIQLRGTASRKKYKGPLRRVTFVDPESQKRLVFLTNDFDLPAETIAAIYKARWEIELFFKAIQQALKIKTFLGTSQNAVLTQVWIALIAYLLLSYFRFQAKSALSVLCLIRRLGRALFQRRELTAWFLHQEPDPAPSPIPPNLQLALGF